MEVADKAIGDLSKEDRTVLKRLAENRNRILEGGVGASTQILTHYGNGTVDAYDTDPKWLERVRDVLFPQVGVRGICRFHRYETGTTKFSRKYDLVFVDLDWTLRLEFALKAWDRLVPDGILVFHDGKRSKDIGNALHFFAIKYREVQNIDVCPEQSNLIIFTKRNKRCDYTNWHKDENLTDEQIGIEWLKK